MLLEAQPQSTSGKPHRFQTFQCPDARSQGAGTLGQKPVMFCALASRTGSTRRACAHVEAAGRRRPCSPHASPVADTSCNEHTLGARRRSNKGATCACRSRQSCPWRTPPRRRPALLLAPEGKLVRWLTPSTVTLCSRASEPFYQPFYVTSAGFSVPAPSAQWQTSCLNEYTRGLVTSMHIGLLTINRSSSTSRLFARHRRPCSLCRARCRDAVSRSS